MEKNVDIDVKCALIALHDLRDAVSAKNAEGIHQRLTTAVVKVRTLLGVGKAKEGKFETYLHDAAKEAFYAVSNGKNEVELAEKLEELAEKGSLKKKRLQLNAKHLIGINTANTLVAICGPKETKDFIVSAIPDNAAWVLREVDSFRDVTSFGAQSDVLLLCLLLNG